MGNGRAKQLADRIQEIVAELLRRRVKDPRLGFITVTEARLTGDLREATVFYTVLGADSDRAETAVALESAKGMLRTEVGRQLGLRHTPSLTFVLDAIPENAQHIEDVLQRARDSDAELSRRSTGATYAGDAYPYRDAADSDGPDEDADDGDETVPVADDEVSEPRGGDR